MSRHTITSTIFKALLFLAACLPLTLAQAHHSAAQYDFSQNVEVTGKIVHLSVANPHIALTLEIQDGAGGTQQIEYEGHSRNNVFRRGWKPGSMKEGDTVTIFIAPLRNGADGGYIQSFKLADGTTF